MQGTHLVMHQRNQRRDDHRDAMPRLLPGDGRDLVAQRFAAAGGHQHQRIATGHHMRNDGLLRAAKLVVAKNFAQDGAAGVGLAAGVGFAVGWCECMPWFTKDFVCYHYNSKLSIQDVGKFRILSLKITFAPMAGRQSASR